MFSSTRLLLHIFWIDERPQLNSFERHKWKGCKTSFVVWLWHLFLSWKVATYYSLQLSPQCLWVFWFSGFPKVVCMICIFPPINLDSCWHFHKWAAQLMLRKCFSGQLLYVLNPLSLDFNTQKKWKSQKENLEFYTF